MDATDFFRLPEDIIVVARERLGNREAAQKGLESAVEAARVPDLLEALKIAEGGKGRKTGPVWREKI